jgi:hypothetical protein
MVEATSVTSNELLDAEIEKLRQLCGDYINVDHAKTVKIDIVSSEIKSA